MPREEKKQEVTEKKEIEETEKILPEKPEALPLEWIPKTSLGQDIFSGKIKDIDEIFEKGIKISEPEIIDALVPGLETELILIGGSAGKGGGIRRTRGKRTTRMHKSGRRYNISIMIAAGNLNGYVGLGLANGPPENYRDILEKATKRAKLNLIPIRRGCGSWECNCAEPHSIPFAVTGKSGSVKIELKPAPKGIGLCVCDPVKKIIRLAGIKDIWCKTRGQTRMRINMIRAVFNAFKKIDRFKVKKEYAKAVGMILGKG